MDIYTETILDYYKNPPNKGKIKNYTHIVEEKNATCGDKIKIYLKTDKNGKITKAMFEGEGCAISQSATSMLLEEIEGKNISIIKKLTPKTIKTLLGINVFPGRTKCATLCLFALKNIFNTL